MLSFRPAQPNDERRSKSSEESRRAQIDREQAMTPEARQAGAQRMADTVAFLRSGRLCARAESRTRPDKRDGGAGLLVRSAT